MTRNSNKLTQTCEALQIFPVIVLDDGELGSDRSIPDCREFVSFIRMRVQEAGVIRSGLSGNPEREATQ